MIRRHVGFLKTTALGGVLFLLPVLVIATLVGQIAPLVWSIAETVAGRLPIRTPTGVAILFALTLAVLILLCFLAGLIARLSLGRRLSHWLERQLIAFFPRYAILRNQFAEKVGSNSVAVQLKPVLVRWPQRCQLGFETDRSENWVAVYLPGSPDTWAGQLVFVDPQIVDPLAMEFSKAVSLCERLGSESLHELQRARSGSMAKSSEGPF